jgi:hypothetical protein
MNFLTSGFTKQSAPRTVTAAFTSASCADTATTWPVRLCGGLGLLTPTDVRGLHPRAEKPASAANLQRPGLRLGVDDPYGSRSLSPRAP